MSTRVMDLYLICIRPRYRHAGHYLGVTSPGRVDARLQEHLAGKGSVLTTHARRAGSELVLARVWRDVPRMSELRLKGRSLLPLCPLCSGSDAMHRRVNLQPIVRKR